MNSAYVTSYDVGLKPFNHDKNRGSWSSPTDFFFACVGHAFKYDLIFIVPALVFGSTGFFGLIPFFILVMLCTLPIILIQSFLGQFSSSGFISVFRIAPLFKGLGYVSLAVNLLTLTYYSIYAAVPLFHFFHSLQPVLPWSCEGSKSWLDHNNYTLACNISKMEPSTDIFAMFEVPSRLFFMHHLHIEPYSYGEPLPLKFSWLLMLCNICVWVAIWFVVTKRTEMVGRIIRYSTATVVGILAVCVIRLGFLPGALSHIEIFAKGVGTQQLESYILLPLLSLSGLGPGWGTILTMASYNKFKTDVTKHSWLLCLGQVGLMALVCLMWLFVRNFWMWVVTGYAIFPYAKSFWMQFASVPTVLAMLELPHFWSILFFGMTAVGVTNVIIVQLFSVLTSLFDEFERFRRSRRELVTVLVLVLGICSMVFCSNHGWKTIELIFKYTILTQILLNLLLLLVVLWVYGRERFQRDFYFMTGRTFSTWMVNVVRFIAPIILIFSFLVALILIIFSNVDSLFWFTVVSILVVFPWLLIPGYCIFKVSQVAGYFVTRFKQCVRPTDWYPMDPEEKQRYEEAFNSTDLSHQLTTAVEEA